MNATVSRRHLLGGAALATAIAPGVAPTVLAAPRTISRFGTTTTTLYLDGQFAGIALGASGGVPFGKVGQALRDAKGPSQKVLTGLGCEPLEITFGAGMTTEWYDWVAAAATPGNTPILRNGAIVMASADSTVQLDFFNAYVSKLVIPARDVRNKEQLNMAVTLTPHSSRLKRSKTSPPAPPQPLRKNKVVDGFRLNVEGLEDASINALLVRDLTITTNAAIETGGRQDAVMSATVLSTEVSNLSIGLPDAASERFFEWFERFAMRGDMSEKRRGLLDFLDTQAAVRATAGMIGLGILRITPDAPDPTTGLRLQNVEMFCEGLQLNLRGLA